MTVLYVIYAIVLIAAILSIPKPTEPQPSSLADVNVPTASADKPIPVVFGTVLLKSPNVVWYGDLSTTEIMSSGGKK